MMTGVSPVTFWFSNILWDGLIFLVSAAACVVALTSPLDENRVFTSGGAAGDLLLNGSNLLTFFATSPIRALISEYMCFASPSCSLCGLDFFPNSYAATGNRTRVGSLRDLNSGHFTD